MSIGSKRKAFTMTMMRHLSAALVVMGFTWLCALPPAAAGEPGASSEPRFVAVTIQGQSCLVKRDGDGETLFESSKALAAIEWALNHSRIVVLKGGTFNVAGTLNIPRPNVTLIIAGDATLQAADKAELDIVSEGHGDYPALVHNKGMDHVASGSSGRHSYASRARIG